jgi:hypothetical protein
MTTELLPVVWSQAGSVSVSVSGVPTSVPS